MFSECLRVLALFFVVPANAGTHNPWRSRLQNLRRNTVFESRVLGGSGPAFAGTTCFRNAFACWRYSSSSLRTQGPITPGVRGCKTFVATPCSNQSPRRMGPRVRGDDV